MGEHPEHFAAKMTHLYKGLTLAICTLLSTAINPATATPACQSALSDPDNDGWGWENNQSCRVPTNLSSETSFCSSSLSDPDGDGWGWEDNQSCRVNPTLDFEINYCDSSLSDPDGDGWGWENFQSCKVASDIPTPSPSTGPTPICNSSTSDPDKDGWGWEDNKSCQVQSMQATAFKVMAVGDSITHGHRSVNSYREPLEKLLDDNGCAFIYVGSQRTNYLFDGYRAPHEGYSGHTADDFINGNNNDAGNNRGIGDSMAAYDPNVVLLHVGSNDMNRGHSVGGTIAEIDQIIDAVHRHNSSTIVLLANIIPWYGGTEPLVASLGDAIEAYVAQLSDQLIQLVDVRSGYSRNMMLADGVHPNAAGEAHIADAFFNVIDKLGLCN